MALQFNRNGLRAIIAGKCSDTKDEGGEAAESLYPIAIAVADGIVTELYKVIDALRADFHYRHRCWRSR
jgi:hypothetical protein